MASDYDAVVVGAGPNGLAAAIELARAGRSVLVREAAETVGGGLRSDELTLPGFVHDVCSAIHPLAAASPFFRTLPLAEHGLEWIEPPVPLAHPLDDGAAVVLQRSVAETAEGLGARRGSLPPAVRAAGRERGTGWRTRCSGRSLRVPRHPIALARFGLGALQPATRPSPGGASDGEPARALFAGLAAHSILPLERLATRLVRARARDDRACRGLAAARAAARSGSRTRSPPTSARSAARS